jgi:hypothetical protein
MKQLLFNPFVKIAGAKALLLGWLFILITIITAYISQIHFTGAFDVKLGNAAPLWLFVFESLLAWLSIVICMQLAATISAKRSVRIIDIAGTMALARWPMLPVTFLGFIPIELPDNISFDLMDYSGALILALLMIPFTIWMIVLMFNGYKVSTGLKGTRLIVSFLIAAIFAEVLSLVIFYQFATYYFSSAA